MKKLGQLKWFTSVIVVLGVLLLSGVGFGQEQPTEPDGRVELGVRQVWGDVYGRPDLPFIPSFNNSKFNEYRDLKSGFFVRSADVSLNDVLGSKNFLRVQTNNSIYKDQSYLVTFGQYNKFKIQFAYDESPHTFTNLARSLFIESSPGVFTVPAAVRTSLVANPTGVPTFLGQPFELTLRRRVTTVGASVNLTPELAVRFRFLHEKKTGSRPIGDYSPGYELPEPTNYRTNEIQAGVEYARQNLGLQFNYLGSLFENKVGDLIWQNATATGVSRIDLYPDNSAHSFNFAGALGLGKKTWLMTSITPGWMRQNDPFVPFTYNTENPALAAYTTTALLPAKSLNGSKQTLAMNYTLTSHPFKHISLTARYRSYDYNNDTPSLFFPTYVLLDSIVGTAAGRVNRQSLAYGFNRKNVELFGTWEFLPKNSVKLGYEFERYDRDHRDIRQSDEHTFLTSWDLNLTKQTLLRISYRHSQRNPDLYENNLENFPLGEPFPNWIGQMEDDWTRFGPQVGRPYFRRFDEAARVRDKADASLQYSPLQSLTLSSFYGTDQNNYNKSEYGVLKDIGYNYGFTVDYSPNAQLSFFGEYTREKYKLRLRSRTVFDGGATPTDLTNILSSNTPNNDWESSNRDVVDTWAFGTDVYMAKRKVVWSTFYSLSAAKGENHNVSLGSLALAPAPKYFLTSSAEDRPNTYNRLHQVVGTVRFALTKNVFPRLEYRYEQYDRVDWQTQVMSPYMFPFDVTAKTQTYLGVDAPSYRGHVFAASLEYRF